MKTLIYKTKLTFFAIGLTFFVANLLHFVYQLAMVLPTIW